MIVMKFGGTSVGSAVRMQEVISVVTSSSDSKLVVLSAMSGTTNALLAIASNIEKDDLPRATILINELYAKYEEVVDSLFADDIFRSRGRQLIDREFAHIRGFLGTSNERNVTNDILAEGELLSTELFCYLCEAQGIDAVLIPALDFMRTDASGEPDMNMIADLIKPIMNDALQHHIIITQGYICRDDEMQISNLQRGGSDYTATLLGAVLQSEEIQIWTDIDGVHNNDPRIVNDTAPIRNLSYREAAELAYFGAKILHPTCVLPAERMRVPLRLKYTMEPEASGTLISDKTSQRSVTAIAAKDGITAIKIYSHRMLNAYGFLRKVFQVFEDHETSVDMITTSEVAVSLTIDDIHQLDSIVKGLSIYGEVEVEHDYSIVCIVGNELYKEGHHTKAIFTALLGIPTRMVSMGGSRNNISILIQSDEKKNALIALNQIFQ